MKKYINILILFPIISMAQYSSAIVTYSVNKIEFEAKTNETKSDKIIDEVKKIAKNQTFQLIFNKSNSSFKKTSALNQVKGDEEIIKLLNKIASLRFTSDFNFYVNNNLNYSINEKDEGILIKDKLKQYNWKITSESKTIENYLCYKATYQYNYIGRDNNIKTRIITAWFAPNLPFSYGPKNYYGLPGLIIELQDWDTTFLATKIELSEKEIEIIFPIGKTISQEEYDKKVSEN